KREGSPSKLPATDNLLSSVHQAVLKSQSAGITIFLTPSSVSRSFPFNLDALRRLAAGSKDFKPFGLTVETIDGNPERSDLHEKYAYFLFSPEITRDRNNASEYEAASASCDSSDHEIFIRGNQIIWSAGSRVHRRYTASSPIVMACWCRMETLPEPTLCVLQVETLTMYRPSGEVVRLPLTHSISSIWSLPFGLLLQRASDGLCPFTTSNPSLSTSDLSRINREHCAIPQYDYSSHCSAGCSVESDLSITASHFILKHPLQEPQVIIVEERGKPSIMNDLDEKIIWTSETIPLVASYNKGKMQHCIWRIDRVVYNSETKAACLRDHAHSPDDLPKQFCFHKIWQGKKSPAQASKVFSATDGDGMPIICFLLQEQKCLFSVRLQTGERFTEIFYDVKPEMSWSVPAIAAAPVVVTRTRVKVSLPQFSDVLVINKEKDILLYSGRQCFCKYTWPINIQLGVNLGHPTCLGQATTGVELKVTGLADAVDGRVNLILENGQMFRCNLQTRPSSSLVNDCITALAEGLHPTFYSQFVVMLWGDGDPTTLAKADIHIDSEWESFTNVIMAMCKRLGFNLSANSDTTQSSWEFLIQSQYHLKYSSRRFFSGFSIGSIHELKDFKNTMTCNLAEQSRETSFCVQFLTEALDALHAVYENYKLDNLRKGDINLLVSLLLGVATSLGESNYVDHYIRDFPVLLLESRIFQPASIPRMPPCLFRWLQACLRNGSKFANCDDLPLLLRRDGSLVVDFSRKIVSFYSLLMGSERVGRKLSSGVYCNLAEGSAYTNEQVVVLAMVAETFGLQQMDQLPAGISLPLRHALDKCRELPPDDWPAAAYMLVGREDLALISLGSFIKCRKHELTSENNLVAFSSPYLLNVRSVTIPSSSLDKIGVNSNKMDDVDTIDGSAPDGMEHVFSSSTQMRFGHDLRLHEVRRLLCSARPVPLQSSASSNSSEQDMQQDLVTGTKIEIGSVIDGLYRLPVQFTDFLEYTASSPSVVDTVSEDRDSQMEGGPMEAQSRDHLFGQVYSRKQNDVMEVVDVTNLNPMSSPDDPSPMNEVNEDLPIALRKGTRWRRRGVIEMSVETSCNEAAQSKSDVTLKVLKLQMPHLQIGHRKRHIIEDDEPTIKSGKYMTWEEDDNMVMSWIMNYVQPQIAPTIAYYTTGKELGIL
ncbi:Anaphase-promoting complex subunit 1, partial [Nymphaea thermarum]